VVQWTGAVLYAGIASREVTSGRIADRSSRKTTLLPRGLVPVSPIREMDSIAEFAGQNVTRLKLFKPLAKFLKQDPYKALVTLLCSGIPLIAEHATSLWTKAAISLL